MKLKSLKSIKDPTISKVKYKWLSEIDIKLDYKQWVKYIDDHQDYFTWYENTPSGLEIINRIDEVPEDFRERELISLNKKQAYAEFNNEKGWYEIILIFHSGYGIVHTTFMKKITTEHLRRMLDMANCLDAYLLNSGKTIIDEKVIEELD